MVDRGLEPGNLNATRTRGFVISNYISRCCLTREIDIFASLTLTPHSSIVVIHPPHSVPQSSLFDSQFESLEDAAGIR